MEPSLIYSQGAPAHLAVVLSPPSLWPPVSRSGTLLVLPLSLAGTPSRRDGPLAHSPAPSLSPWCRVRCAPALCPSGANSPCAIPTCGGHNPLVRGVQCHPAAHTLPAPYVRPLPHLSATPLVPHPGSSPVAYWSDHCHVRPGMTGQASPYLARSRSFPTHSSFAARPPAHWPRFGSALPTRRSHLGIASPRHLPRPSPPWRAPASSRAPRARTETGTTRPNVAGALPMSGPHPVHGSLVGAGSFARGRRTPALRDRHGSRTRHDPTLVGQRWIA